MHGICHRSSARPNSCSSSSAELLAGDPVALGQKRCALLSRLTGVQQSAIWQWGFIERLVNGLRYIEVGPEANAEEFLAVVEAWAEVDTIWTRSGFNDARDVSIRRQIADTPAMAGWKGCSSRPSVDAGGQLRLGDDPMLLSPRHRTLCPTLPDGPA